VCVCAAVTLPKSSCRVVLNVSVGMLIGKSAVQLRLCGVVVMYTMNNHTYNAILFVDNNSNIVVNIMNI